MILVTKTSDQTRQRGHTLSTCTNLTWALSTLCSPPLLPYCSLGYPGWQLLNQPFLFYIFLAFHPCLPRFPHGVYSYFAVSCAFSPPVRPPQSYSRSRYRRPRSHLRYSPRFRPRSHPVFVYGSCVYVCVCCHPIYSGRQVVDVPAGVTQEKGTGNTGFIRLLSAVLALIFSREGFSLSFPWSTVTTNFVYERTNRSLLVGQIFLFFYFFL